MSVRTQTRRMLGGIGIDLRVLVFALVLIGAELWYLTTQATAVLLPAIWMVAMDVFLLLYALEESLVLSEVAIVLFFGRFFFLPFLLLTPIDDLLLFYVLFMAPVDVGIVAYVIRSAGSQVGASSHA